MVCVIVDNILYYISPTSNIVSIVYIPIYINLLVYRLVYSSLDEYNVYTNKYITTYLNIYISLLISEDVRGNQVYIYFNKTIFSIFSNTKHWYII